MHGVFLEVYNTRKYSLNKNMAGLLWRYLPPFYRLDKESTVNRFRNHLSLLGNHFLNLE